MSKFSLSSADHCGAVDRPGRFMGDDGGNVVITAAIVFVFLAGAVGAAVSYSAASATRANMQAALDAAVLAGTVASDTGQDQIVTANNVFQSNLGRFAQNSTTQIGATFKVDGLVLSGVATGSVKNPFGDVIGSKIIPVNVTSAATKQTTPVCVLGLNGLDNGSFDINGSKAVFNAVDCAVQANTTSKTGMTEEGSPTANAKKFGVSGGHKGDTFSPPPSDGSAKVADPYASLPFPYYDSCPQNSKMLEIKDSTPLKQGTYCGGIHVFGDSTTVTLEKGIYVMVDGPFWTDASSVVTGDQVMIAFTGKGATLQLWGDSSVTLTSPISGTYMNMQFMQDNNDPNTHGLWVSLGGNGGGSAKLQYDGVAYFPTQNFWAFGNSVVNANSPSVAILADKVWTQGSATVNVTNNNPRNLSVTTPQTTYGARLIQ